MTHHRNHIRSTVRHECFCAHPYVKEMVFEDLLEAVEDIDEESFDEQVKLKSGMVRASFGLYNTHADVDALVTALKEIAKRRDEYRAEYSVDREGNYLHRSFAPDDGLGFSVRDFADRYVEENFDSK